MFCIPVLLALSGNGRAQDMGSLAVFVGNPNKNDPTAEAAFQGRCLESRLAVGQGITHITGFVDYRLPFGQRWIESATWWRTSVAASAAARAWVPIYSIGLADGVTADPLGQMLAIGNPGDSVYGPVFQNIVSGFRTSGFGTLYLRIGWEHNGEWYPWGTANADKSFNPERAAAFVAAFRRVADIAHSTAGIRVLTVWSPNFERLTPAQVAATYPGDGYVDIIAPDMYSPVWNSIEHNWDPSVQGTLSDDDWKANTINRQHTWDYPAATPQQPTAGYGLVAMMQFALERNKPFGLGETGTDGGMSGSWYRGPEDRGDFPLYLTKRLSEKREQGLRFAYLGLWNTASYRFSAGARPLDTGGWVTLINTLAGADPFEAEEAAIVSSSDAVTAVADPGATGNYVPDPSRQYVRDADIGGHISKFNGNAPGDFVEYQVPVLAPGTYDVRMRIKRHYSRGIYRLDIDGVFQGRVDHFADAQDFVVVDYGPKTFLTAGLSTFRFTVMGRHERNSSGYSMAIDYFDLSPHRLEAETLAARAASDATTIFREPALSHGAGEKLESNAIGDFVEYVVPVVEPGTYSVRVRVKRHNARGIFQLYVEGAYQGFEQDLYAPPGDPNPYVELDLGTKTFGRAGDKVFRFVVTGRNPASSGHTLAFDYISLTRL